MSENWKIQVSVKLADFADPMVNIRAESGLELDQLLSYVLEKSPDIARTIEALRATAKVTQQLPVAQVTLAPATVEQSQPAGGWNVQAQTPPPGFYQQQQSPPTAQYQQPQAQFVTQAPQQQNSTAQPGPAPVCRHGQMKWLVDNKNAQPRWGGFFCPAQKGDPSKCTTQYAFSERS